MTGPKLLFLACAAAATLLGCAAQTDGSSGQAVPIQRLPQFSAIQACVPFNIYITPSGRGNEPDYGLQVQAEPAVAEAIRWTVGNGTLALETQAFTTQQPIKVVVYLPPSAFTELDHLGQLSSVYVGAGFTPDSFTLRQAAGGGGVFIFNMTASTLVVSSLGGIGDAVALGTFGTAEVATQGISNVYIQGVTQSVTLDLGGVSNIYLENGGADVSITGRASGISNVYYSQGQCSVQSVFLLSSPCQLAPGISAAGAVPTPSWTQGLIVTGGVTCAVGASFITTPAPTPIIQPLPFPGLPPLLFPIPAPAPAAVTPVTPPPVSAPSVPPTVPAVPPTTAPSTQTSAQATPGAQAGATATTGGMPAQAPPAPPPMPEVTAGGPYAFTIPSATGSQMQAGSAGPGGSQAASSATGQRQASATSIAGPTGAATGTISDGQGAQGSTQG